MTTPTLGILTLYLNERKSLEERHVYEKMIAAGKRLGIGVFVFTPDDVDGAAGRINALVFRPDTRTWSRKLVRFPNMIYDRCRIQRSERFERLLAFRRKYAHLLFLNRPLRNKWTVYRTLGKENAFRAHLPVTRLFQSTEDLTAMVKRFPTIYFKPVNGTGGRGILRIDRRSEGGYLVQGRDHARRIVQPRRMRREMLPDFVRAWDKRGDRYIVQQGLNTKLANGRVHDFRMLVQKNGSGAWEVTGCAGRIGPAKSITSNLHGGGQAASMNELLRQGPFSSEQIREIRETSEKFGTGVARHLESSFGALCELALDLAIDRNGRVWLLEVNPKPAREVFIQAGERDVYRKAIVRPLEYALWLYRQRRDARSRSGAAAQEARSGGGASDGSGGSGGASHDAGADRSEDAAADRSRPKGAADSIDELETAIREA